MSEKMKIIIIGSAYPLRGGLSNYNERLARELMDQGHTVIIETFKLQYPNLLFPGKSQYSEDAAPPDLNIRVSLNSVNPYNWWKVGNRLKKENADLVICKFWLPFMGPCFGTVLRRIRKNRSTRVISILDNIIPHEKRPGDRIMTKYFVKAVDGFIAMSHSVLDDLNVFDTMKPRLFNPHPLYDNFGEILPKSVARDKLDLDPDEKIILFFGFIRGYKGLDLLIAAMDDPRIREMKIRLLVAGEFYTDQKPYHQLIKDKELVDSIILSNDFIPDSKVGVYFCASDLVVQPYKTATQSGVTQIAYHFNKPMITTDVGGLAEIVPHEKVGYVVKPDVKSIADGIVRFYEGSNEDKFSANVKTEKQKYSWDKMAEKIFELDKKINKQGGTRTNESIQK